MVIVLTVVVCVKFKMGNAVLQRNALASYSSFSGGIHVFGLSVKSSLAVSKCDSTVVGCLLRWEKLRCLLDELQERNRRRT